MKATILYCSLLLICFLVLITAFELPVLNYRLFGGSDFSFLILLFIYFLTGYFTWIITRLATALNPYGNNGKYWVVFLSILFSILICRTNPKNIYVYINIIIATLALWRGVVKYGNENGFFESMKKNGTIGEILNWIENFLKQRVGQ